MQTLPTLPFRRFPIFLSWIGLVALAVAMSLSTARGAEAEVIRPWIIGETVETDVITPVQLVVFDPEQTEALRQAEAQKVPPIFRFDPAMTRVAEAELQNRFATARNRFLALIEAAFQQRTLQAVADLSDPRFSEAMVVFRSRNAGFPLSTNLAELWALGDAGAVVLDDLSAKLNRFMTVHLRADRLPEGERLSAPSIRIVPADPSSSTNSAPRPAPVAARGTNIPRASLYPLTRYKRELAGVAPAEERPLINFVAGFLRPNCVFDEEATALARERRIQDINVVDQYDPGQIVARRGQTVDARLKLALDALRAHQEARLAGQNAARLRSDVEQMKTQASLMISAARAEQLKAAAAVTAVRQDVVAAEQRNRRLIGGIAGVSAGCLLFAGLWWRYRSRQRRLEKSVGWAVVPAGGGADEAGLWRERALAAEVRAEKATAMLRTNLLPHMARWMMSELVQRLLSQRTAVQDSQQRAELEVAELAGRLEKLQAPLEERLRAYERRVAELEADLAAKDQQNHQLIQAKIESTRRQMEVERASEGSWN